MKHVFESDTVVPIGAGSPSAISSTIDVAGVIGPIVRTTVMIDLDHTYTRDLKISLEGPSGDRVLLVGGRGGNGDNFRETVFDDDSSSAVADADAPFRGTFAPEEGLSAFAGSDADGAWTLHVEDGAFLDGGSLNRWILCHVVDVGVVSSFNIEVRFLGGLTTAQESVFEAAAARWAEVIVGDLPEVGTEIGVVDDVVIDAQGSEIDGISGVLGQAGPTRFRPGTLLPARGIMSFDSADIANMERDGSFFNVIVHEMGHVLGIGTLWQAMGLLVGAGTLNPRFVGTNAMREFGALVGTGVPTPVPVANTGGPGTADGHWRETVFGHELLTGFLDVGFNPLSRVSIAALEDMGYAVDYDAADPYVLPTALQLALMGVGGETDEWCRRCQAFSPGAVELTEAKKR